MATAAQLPRSSADVAPEMTLTSRVGPTRAEPPLLLHSGDHLTADEFERRYEGMPGVRAELVEGVVYVASPVSVDHSEPHLEAMVWMGTYLTETRGVTGGIDSTIRLDLDNRPQPDGHLRIRPEFGGRARISDDRYIVGAPEFVIEIARSTVSYDLHDKLNAYRRNEVLDYVIWRFDDAAIDWFTLRGGRYERLAATPEGHFRSPNLPGLWLDPGALISGDLTGVLRALHDGLNSPEHAAFVAVLAERAAAIAARAPAPPPEAPAP